MFILEIQSGVIEMNRKLVFLYAGQGSQFYQMGRDIYETDTAYKKEIDRLDCIVEEIADYSVWGEIFREDRKRFDTFCDIKYSHPSIFMSQIALTKSLLNRGIRPDYYMGCSLGEIVAVALATDSVDEFFLGTLSQCNILKESKGGGMIAVFDNLKSFDALNGLCRGCYLASINYGQMYVISGSNENLEIAKNYLVSKNILYQRLSVNYAFHSPEIDCLKPFIKKDGERYLLNKIRVPVISCCESGTILQSIPKEHFWNIIRKMIDFYGAIIKIMQSGESYLLVDLSFSGSQANYIRRITNDDRIRVYSPFSLFKSCDTLEHVCETIKLMMQD